MTAIGQRVRSFRELTGLTQTELARQIGVEQTTISNIETGYSKPSLKVLIRLAKLFNVTLDDLISETDAAEPIPQPA